MEDNLIVLASYGLDRAVTFLKAGGTRYNTKVIRTDMPKIKSSLYDQTPYKGYDTGAYLWAYWHYPATKYLFVQDSVIPKDKYYADIFFKKLDEYPVVAWVSFPFNIWDSQEQITTSQYLLGKVIPEKGIFGPIFAVRKEALDLLAEKQLLPPYPMHKENAQAKEREWAMAFYRAGIDVHFIVNDWNGMKEQMRDGNFPSFRKEFGGRK